MDIVIGNLGNDIQIFFSLLLLLFCYCCLSDSLPESSAKH